tara:strand:- start:17476 stop:17838 length:363 start_codon:yes stop_codon:yes gene_type:complete
MKPLAQRIATVTTNVTRGSVIHRPKSVSPKAENLVRSQGKDESVLSPKNCKPLKIAKKVHKLANPKAWKASTGETVSVEMKNLLPSFLTKSRSARERIVSHSRPVERTKHVKTACTVMTY